MRRQLGWLMNEDYQGIGGYSSSYSEGGSYAAAPTTAPAYGYANPLVTSEMQSFIAASTGSAINAPQYSAPTYTPYVPPQQVTSYSPPALPAQSYVPTAATPTIPAYTPPATTGAQPMSYDYYGGAPSAPAYTPAPYTPVYGEGGSSSSDYTPQYVNVTPSAFTYTPTDSSLPVEQVTVTGYTNPQQYVQAPDIILPTGQDYSGLTQTPALPDYGTTKPGDGYGNYGMPNAGGQKSAGSGGSTGGGSGGGQAPQQQKQSPPVQVNISIPQRSGSGYGGGNRYHRISGNYTPGSSGGYGGSGSATYGPSSAQGSGGQAGYNAPSIIPYLLIGGLGLLAYNMLGKKEHHHARS